MIVVRDRISNVRELRLEPWLLSLEKALTDFTELAGVLFRAVLQYSLASFISQIEPVKTRILRFKFVDDAQRLKIMLEATEILHAGIERILSSVAERRVAQVVSEAYCFRQHLIEAECACDRPGNLRNFQGVRQPRSIKVALVIHEYLCLVHKPAERRRVNNPVPVSLKLPAIRGLRFIESTAEALFLMCRVRFQCVHRPAAYCITWLSMGQSRSKRGRVILLRYPGYKPAFWKTLFSSDSE